ncbi:MAG TPA: tetratricopeptide repeat protein [Blastocatellia bacterium]|nr:tetratricopeptide repeat protein [Blastocatellia bacterium]
MSAAVICFLMMGLLIVNSVTSATRLQASPQESPAGAQKSDLSEFDRLRIEGFNAVYNIDYKTARERFLQMTRLAPDHPAGYVYLANNLWLETLYQSRRLSTSVYTGESFYAQDKDEDKVDPKRDRDFNDYIRQAIAAARARLAKNPKDVEALYYNASALGIRAAYGTSVKRSFTRAIGDANESIKIQRQVIKLDPGYIDAYLSIGLYEYVIDSLPGGLKFLARLAGLKGSKQKGIEHLERVTREGKFTADDARVVLLGIYSKENNLERALEIISHMVNQYPRNYLFGVERASMLYRTNRAEEGSRAFADLLKDERVGTQAIDLVNFYWGEALLAKQDYAGAIARYKDVQRWPKSNSGLVSFAHLHVGEALDALGKREEAMVEYQMVLKRENVFDSHKLATQYVKRPYMAVKS